MKKSVTHLPVLFLVVFSSMTTDVKANDARITEYGIYNKNQELLKKNHSDSC